MNPFRTAALLGTLAVTVPAVGAAQEEGAAPESSESAPRFRNKLSGFVGGTVEHEGTAFTLGLDYERRLGPLFGVGVIIDKAFGGERAFIAAGALYWHPLPPMRLDIAPGFERIEAEDESAFVLRLGADYDFEIKERWSLGPNVNLDLANGRAVFVFGAELGFSF
ncbi:MAG: hypothetical protein H6Q77_275 [Gemmatimonadetes bacterium]|nr:hypothetical protein [Gemmatimonadota bacterium]